MAEHKVLVEILGPSAEAIKKVSLFRILKVMSKKFDITLARL